MRHKTTAALLYPCADDVLVGAPEVHVLTAIAKATVEQCRVPGMPAPIKGLRQLSWRFGDARAALTVLPALDQRQVHWPLCN